MARKDRRDRPKGLDAELARLLEDPDTIPFEPRKIRRRRRLRRTGRGPGASRGRGQARRPRAVGLPSPVFLVLVVLTAVGAVVAGLGDAGSRLTGVGVFVFVLAGWLVSVCLHEFAHAYTAHRGGDDAIEGRDYLRLNPFKYIHPLLSIGLPLVSIIYGGIGLPGGAVLVHRHRLRSRLWRSAVSAAGPLVNVLVAAVTLVAVHLMGDRFYGDSGFALYAALGWFAWLQISASVLNLVPIPGLDGFGILEPWLAEDTVRSVDKVRPYGLLILVVLLILPGTSHAFSTLVDHLSTLVGDPEGLPYFGQQLFRFWS